MHPRATQSYTLCCDEKLRTSNTSGSLGGSFLAAKRSKVRAPVVTDGISVRGFHVPLSVLRVLPVSRTIQKHAG